MSKKRYKYHPDDEPYAPIFKYYDCMAIAKNMGFNSLSDAIAETYKEQKTIAKTAKKIGVSTTKIRTSLIKQGISRKKEPKTRRHDYHPADEKYSPIHFYDDALYIANDLGYESYSEAVVSVYRKCKSQRITATAFGVSAVAIRIMLKKMGEPMNGPGGNNRRKINIEDLKCHNAQNAPTAKQQTTEIGTNQ